MTKETRRYFLTTDGSNFPTKEEAYEHEREKTVESKLNEMGMSSEEMSNNLSRAAERYPLYQEQFDEEPIWEYWPIHVIRLIDEDLFDESVKIVPEKK